MIKPREKIFYFYYLSINFVQDLRTEVLWDIVNPEQKKDALFIRFTRTASNYGLYSSIVRFDVVNNKDFLIIQDYPISRSTIPLTSGRPIPLTTSFLCKKVVVENLEYTTGDQFKIWSFQMDRKFGDFRPWIKGILKLIEEDSDLEKVKNINFF